MKLWQQIEGRQSPYVFAGLLMAGALMCPSAEVAASHYINQHEAIAIARSQFQGDRRLSDLSLRHTPAFDYYETVFTQRNGRVSNIKIDARTGAVIDMEYFDPGDYGREYDYYSTGYGYPGASGYSFDQEQYQYGVRDDYYRYAGTYAPYDHYPMYDPYLNDSSYFSGRQNSGPYDRYYGSISQDVRYAPTWYDERY